MLENIKSMKHKKNWRAGIPVVGIAMLIIVAAYLIATSQNYFRNGIDFFSLWLAPHLLLENKNPYNTDDWKLYHELSGVAVDENSPFFLYPLSLAVILIPLGILPLEYAAVLWTAMSIAAILLAGYYILCIRKKRWPITYLIPTLIGVFLLRPVAETLRLGQLDWLILLWLVFGLFFWEKQQWFVGGMFIALTIVKPQIGIPLLLFLSLWLAMRRKWSGLLGEGVILISLFFIGWIFNHSWLWQWLRLGINKIESTICCTPTLWGLASLFCKFKGNCGLIFGLIMAVLVSVLLIFLLVYIPSNKARFAIGLCIPVILLISPYLWTYSQMILVIPIFIIVDILKQKDYPYMLVAPFPLYLALVSSLVVFISIKIGVDVISSTIPMVIFAVLLWLKTKIANDWDFTAGLLTPPMRE